MSRPVPTRGLVEGALLAVVLVLLVVITFYIPASGLLFGLFWPAPIALLYLRYDSRVATLAVLVSAAILIALVGPVDALDVAFLYGPLGLALGHAAKRRWSAGRTLALGAGAVAVATAGTIATFWVLAGQAPGVWLNQDVSGLVESLRTLEQSSLLTGGGAELVAGVLRLVPWLVLVLSGCMALLVDYLATRALFVRLGYPMPALPRFRDWRFPAWIRVASALAVVVWFARAGLPAGRFLAVVTGLLPFAMATLVLQSLAIIEHALASRGAPLLLRIVLYVLLLFTFGTAWLLLAAAAVVDTVFDLRRRISAPVTPADPGGKEDAREGHPHSGHQDSRQEGKRRRGS